MADFANRVPGPVPAAAAATGPAVDRYGTPWGAVWAGAFSAAAIWTVFGELGVAIFRTTGGLNTTGVSWGMGVWSIILTGIALFVGGRVTGRMGELRTRRDAAMAGQTMFGLTAVGLVLTLALMGTGANAAGPSYVGYAIRSAGWFGWVGVLCGWIGAMAGATGAQRIVRQAATPVRDIRNAA